MWYFGNSNDAVSSVVRQYIGEHLGQIITTNFTYTIKVKDDKILAAVIFENYNGHNVDVHIYAKGHMDRKCIRTVFSYAFNTLKCVRLTSLLPIDNSVMRSIIERLGFEKEGTLKNYYGLDKHCDVYRMDSVKARKWID